MKQIQTEEANQFVQAVVGKPLQYGYLYREFGMFDFGFGNEKPVPPNQNEKRRCVYEYALHVVCEYDVVRKNGERCVKRVDWETEPQVFRELASSLVGLTVKRAAVDETNRLWLDLGEYWLVFLPLQSEAESWRFFSPYSDTPHLAASAAALWLQE